MHSLWSRLTLLGLAALVAARPKPMRFDDFGSVSYDNTTAGALKKSAKKHAALHASMSADVTYSLEATYDASNWIDSFDTEALGTADPTGGFVNYLSLADAQSQGLYKIENNQIYIGVDTSTVLNPSGTGRNSVRIESTTTYTHGLFILDADHIPGSVCGSWPAYWMYGPNWPAGGEIDIIEGVNAQATDVMTLHTDAGCTVTVGDGGQTGTSGNADCNANNGYDGCGVTSNTADSYGTSFNSAGGGVFATFWNEGNIQIWYFPRASVPSDITAGNPTPLNWGTPMAHFAGCAFDDYIYQNQITFDITFCGAWAGNVWGSSTCASQAATCNDYVAANPGAFSESYWLINSLTVYSVTD